MSATIPQIIIIGAGPAGLTAAYELSRYGQRSIVLEKSNHVGGIARTEVHDGCRFDIGGHRFFTKVPEVQQLWDEVMGDDFLKVPRLSRIFYGGKFYDYPLSIFNTLRNLGAVESARILVSYLRARIRSRVGEETFEQWVTNRFGRRLFQTFFKTYTEKVWGIGCDQIRAEWAAQRIKGVSLRSAVMNAFFGTGDAKSLIKEFDYPALGPGMMWERFAAAVEKRGSVVHKQVDAISILREGMRITSVIVEQDGKRRQIAASNVMTTMPITELVRKLDPVAPPEVLAAAAGLRYRDFILVGLIVGRQSVFPDNWIYVHTPGVKVGRIQNFGNWSRAMLADTSKSSLGLEYFCNEGDELWSMGDDALIELAKRELCQLNLTHDAPIEGGVVIRQRKAYPVYDAEYRGHLDIIRKYLIGFTNLQTIGRNGMHRYNNQDHSMLTAILAVRNYFGARHDLWEVNTERSYHEEFEVNRKAQAGLKPATFADEVEPDYA